LIFQGVLRLTETLYVLFTATFKNYLPIAGCRIPSSSTLVTRRFGAVLIDFLKKDAIRLRRMASRLF
jgi:hypothetical protein